MPADPGQSLFVSDLHLAPERGETIALFLGFLAGRARRATRLFVLGDLFETWIGDDDDTPAYMQVRDGLRALTDSGTQCALMRGNRDFLLGRAFCTDTGCRLLADPELWHFGAEPTLLMHGDLLCTDDIAYQRFRRRIRHPLVTWLFRRKSLASRRAIAAAYRLKSGAATSAKPADIMDVNQDTVADYLRRHRATRLIHGHTHRPAEHRLHLDGQPVYRSVLAEWHPHGGEVLVHDAAGWRREPVG
mgnify:CR=1 FL=1